MFVFAVASSAAEVVRAPTEPVVQGERLLLLVAPPTDPPLWESFTGGWWVEARSADREAPVLLVGVDVDLGGVQGGCESKEGELVAVQRQIALTPGAWTVRIARVTAPISRPADDAWTEVPVTVRAPTSDEARAMVWQPRDEGWGHRRCDEGVLSGDVFVPAIVGRLGGPLDPATRETLLGGLSATPTEAATDALLGLLDHRDPVVRLFALDALAARATAPRVPWAHDQAIVPGSFATAPFDPADLPVLKAAAGRMLVDGPSDEGARRARIAARVLAAVARPGDGAALTEALDLLVGVPVIPGVLEPMVDARARLGIVDGPLALGGWRERPDPVRVEPALLAGLAHPAASVQAFALGRVAGKPSPAVREAVITLARRATADLDPALWTAVARIGPPFPAEIVLDAVPRAARSTSGLGDLVEAAARVEVPRDALAARIAELLSDPAVAHRALEALYDVVLGGLYRVDERRVAALAAAWPAWVKAHASELAAGRSFALEDLPEQLRP